MPIAEKILLYLVFLLVGIGICMLLDRFVWQPPTSRKEREKRERERRELDERLASPRYEEIEARAGFPVPRSLRELYAEPRFLEMDAFQVRFEGAPEGERGWELFDFFPLDAQAVIDRSADQGITWLRFARDGHGDYYYALALQLCSEDDGPLYAIGEGGDEPEKVADSLRDFLARREPIVE